MPSDNPVNWYKNKFMFNIVSCHINYLFTVTTVFSRPYSEMGHGKGEPDRVRDTLKRTAHKSVSEVQDIVILSSLENCI